MKQFFLILICLFINITYAQNLKVEYDRINKQFNNSPLLAESSEAFKSKVKEEMQKPQKQILYVKDGNTFFKSILKADIIHEEESKKIDEFTSIKPKTKFVEKQIKIYRKKGDKGFYQYQNFNEDEFYRYFTPKFNKIDYKDDIEYIEKYKCKLAEVTTEQGILTKVWYTEDIPASVGPYAYGNLPGLILKIESPEFVIYATKISNDTTAQDFEIPNPQLKVLNEDDYIKKMSEIREESKKVKKTESNINL
ncbi:hypothetical protein ACM39_17600 [Chryseobacterium sp. FH2]|uniref:GLPGLI family protein n=1 Tax=Chryseobacterium sp. FH2 TaxID=1674291 RepID=UPI00065AAD20|nr:GLPGLI family protein [Chryseobacterium sp. FH2]KMQ62924.1 hypothetical protein ACM39_17600 [Chryseobacterium sp. FH2]